MRCDTASNKLPSPPIIEVITLTINTFAWFGGACRTRTCNPLVRRQILYQAALHPDWGEHRPKTLVKSTLLDEKATEECKFKKWLYAAVSLGIAHHQFPSRDQKGYFKVIFFGSKTAGTSICRQNCLQITTHRCMLITAEPATRLIRHLSI